MSENTKQNFRVIFWKIIIPFFLVLGLVWVVNAAFVEMDHFRRINPNQPYPQFGYVELRNVADGALTGSYVDTDHTRVDYYTQIALALDITQGGLTSLEYIIWWSKDGTNWFQEVTETVAASVITHVACNYTIALTGDIAIYAPVPFVANYIKVQVKGTGTVTGSAVIVAIFGHHSSP